MCFSVWVHPVSTVQLGRLVFADRCEAQAPEATDKGFAVRAYAGRPSCKARNWLASWWGVPSICTLNTSLISLRRYTGMGHSSCPQEVQDVRNWLLR
jgi:hypothetical protein